MESEEDAISKIHIDGGTIIGVVDACRYLIVVESEPRPIAAREINRDPVVMVKEIVLRRCSSEYRPGWLPSILRGIGRWAIA
jgi:hypothetical protein